MEAKARTRWSTPWPASARRRWSTTMCDERGRGGRAGRRGDRHRWRGRDAVRIASEFASAVPRSAIILLSDHAEDDHARTPCSRAPPASFDATSPPGRCRGRCTASPPVRPRCRVRRRRCCSISCAAWARTPLRSAQGAIASTRQVALGGAPGKVCRSVAPDRGEEYPESGIWRTTDRPRNIGTAGGRCGHARVRCPHVALRTEEVDAPGGGFYPIDLDDLPILAVCQYRTRGHGWILSSSRGTCPAVDTAEPARRPAGPAGRQTFAYCSRTAIQSPGVADRQAARGPGRGRRRAGP